MRPLWEWMGGEGGGRTCIAEVNAVRAPYNLITFAVSLAACELSQTFYGFALYENVSGADRLWERII